MSQSWIDKEDLRVISALNYEIIEGILNIPLIPPIHEKQTVILELLAGEMSTAFLAWQVRQKRGGL